MLGELGATRVPLPLVQFTAAMLWTLRDRGRKLLTRASYRDLGGVAGALSTHADAVVAGLSAERRALARAVLLRLVTAERTRAVVAMSELRDLAGTGVGPGPDDSAEHGARSSAVDAVIQHLAAARLLVIEGGEGDGANARATVELVHESLIERWATLAQWLDDSAGDVHFVARVRVAAEHWHSAGEADELLWRGPFAADARQWLEQQARAEPVTRVALGRREQRFLNAVVARTERARRRRRRILTAGLVLTAAVLAIVALLAVRAERQAVRAELEAALARNASRMASARELLDDPALVIAVLRELEPAHRLPRGWSGLAHGALNQAIAEVIIDHPEAVHYAAFSPDGRRVVTASLDHRARVHSADGTALPVILEGHRHAIKSVLFSPDGRRVVTASADRTVRVWNADGSGQPLVLRGHSKQVLYAAFSRDGSRIISASRDGTARIWAADGSGQPHILSGHSGIVFSASFSRDGRRVVTASEDGTARVWDAATGAPLTVLTGHENYVRSAHFDPSGQRIVTASTDRTVRIWNADGSGQPRVLSGHLEQVTSARFSPDGTRV
ncbi:MAG: WD40 repeat domain-containing protein, partial [Myxococcota bacterium]